MYSIKYFRGYSIKDVWNQFYNIFYRAFYRVFHTLYIVECIYIGMYYIFL